jgi:hypothetical protein
MPTYYKQNTSVNVNYFKVEDPDENGNQTMIRVLGLSNNTEDIQLAFADSRYFNINNVKELMESDANEWNIAINIFLEKMNTYKS